MKKSTSNNIISMAVINSNLKRFMPIIFLGIAYFFFLYIFPGYFTENIELYLKEELSYTMMGIRLYCAGMPLITSVVLFNFIHKKNSVIFHHSIPIKRSQMYISLILLGIILINLPLVIFGMYISVILNIEIALKVIGFGFISSTFVFSICTLAGIITGTTVMHFIVACWFNFLPQSIYFVLTSFGRGLLNGYSNEGIMNILTIMSPETHHFEVVSYKSLIYLGIAALLFVITGVLYKKLKLEKSENAIVFTSLKIILNIIVSVYFMALLGLVVYNFKNTTASFIIGSVTGAILGVYLGYIVFNKTFKIFNVKTFKLAGALVLVSMLISLAFVYDIMGYETKIPSVDQIKSVQFDDINFDRRLTFNTERQAFKAKENISNVVKIHNRCVSLGKIDMNATEDIEVITINYQLENKKELQREYYISSKDPVINKYRHAIFNSKENKENMMLEYILPYSKSAEVTDMNTGETYSFSGKELIKLIKALDKDIMEEKYSELMLNSECKYDMFISTKNNNRETYSINIFSNDKNAIKYIESKMK